MSLKFEIVVIKLLIYIAVRLLDDGSGKIFYSFTNSDMKKAIDDGFEYIKENEQLINEYKEKITL